MSDKELIEKVYYNLINLARHKVLRIREYEYGLKNNLSESDKRFKEEFEVHLKKGLTWRNFAIKWTIYFPGLKKIVKEKFKEIDREEILLAKNYRARVKKSTNNIIN